MTLSALGIFSAAGAGGVAAGSYDLIETYILGSSQASVVFSSLGDYSSTYKHLQIRYTAKSDRSSGDGNDAMIMRLNSDSGSNYNSHILLGDGSSVGSGYESGNLTSMDYSYIAGTGGNISGGYGFGVMDFLDAYSTTKFKTRRALWGNSLGGSYKVVGLSSGLWRNTNAISTITFLPRYGTNLVAGSRFSLYGIKG
jgi:hypothetical protein